MRPYQQMFGNIRQIKRFTYNFFLSSFSSDEYYHFFHETSLKLNEVFSYVSEIFDNPNSFHKQSINLAKHLYNESIYPNIKSGEFYIVHFKGTTFDGKDVDVLGLFKTEKKDFFIRTTVQEDNVCVTEYEGVNLKKPDKGCLIFNINKDNGYIVEVIDNTNKVSQARYWTEHFLHVCQINNAYSNTKNVMSLTKSFVAKALPLTDVLSKKDQIELLNKSLEYFKEKKSFNIADFEAEVISRPEVILQFREYKEEYESARDISIDNDFQLSETAIKKQQRSYKRALNLDKKIQIIINGNTDLIEKGSDSKGKFYKIYYNEEK